MSSWQIILLVFLKISRVHSRSLIQGKNHLQLLEMAEGKQGITFKRLDLVTDQEDQLLHP